jgi:ABC-2 type transport system permease protein
MAYWEFFKIHLKQIYRNKAGIFWTIVVPVAIYVAVSFLPLENLVGLGVNYSEFLLPGIIAMVVMQGGIYTLAYATIEAKSHGVLKRLAVTPLTKSQFITTMLAARLTVVLAQALVLTIVGVLVFNTQFHWPILTITIFVLLGGAIFLLLGLIISTFADSYESAAPITAGLGLPLAFLGNIFYPVEKLPESLQAIAQVLPITHLSDALRQAYITGAGLADLWQQAVILVAWLLGFFIVAVWRFRLES